MYSDPPFQVRTSGCVADFPYHSTPGTKAGDIMLTAFVSGRGVYQNSQGIRRVRGGMIGLVTPTDPGVLASDPRHPYSHYYCRFNGAYAFHMAREILAHRRDCFFEHGDALQVSSCLKQMGRYAARELGSRMGWREVRLVEALVTLAGRCSDAGEFKLSAHTMDDYLDEHIGEPTDLAKMGTYFGVSKATLCRKAKRWYGLSVQKLHESKKMAHAQTLLMLRGFSISDVASRTGYYDPLYFSRVFRRYTGCSPKAFRAHQTEKTATNNC